MDHKARDEILLQFLRFEASQREAPRLEQLSISDWEVLVQQSVRQGVTPLIYHRVKKLDPGLSVPANVLERLRESYLQSSARNLRLYHQLGKLLLILQHDDIPVIPLKGAHLAEIVYGNIALRPMGDIDLLVRQEDLARVDEKMLKAGYTPMECNREVAKDNWHFSYMLGESGLCVEVHWSLIESLYPFRIDTDGLWQRSRPAVIAGAKAFVLSPEDLLLHLCLHNAKHVFELGIKHICDISETLWHYGEEMDWNFVKGSTEQWGIERCVYINLRLAKELLGAVVPDWLLDELKPTGFHEGFLTQAEQQIFAQGEERRQTTEGLSLWVNVAQLWQKKGFLNKLFYFVRRIFRAREEMARMYPAASDSTRIYLYYPVRIRDLLVKHGRQAWRLWRGDKEMKILLKAEQDLAPLKEWLMSS